MDGGRVDAELQGFQPVEIDGDTIQLRFDPVAVPSGAAWVVPTLTLSHDAWTDLATKLKLLASGLPMMPEDG